jgi:hypothetical protein
MLPGRTDPSRAGELTAVLRAAKHAARKLLLAAGAGAADEAITTNVRLDPYRTKRRFASGIWKRRSGKSLAREPAVNSKHCWLQRLVPRRIWLRQ